MSLSGERSHLEAGYRLDRYELLCPIAHGGMASVWLARLHGKHGFEKLVAVKTILPQYASDPRFQRMFLDEARIAAGIEHANVAQILDLGEQHGVLYLVMEWIDGDSLSKLQRTVRKRGRAMPMGIVLRIMADICAGLHAAHELRDPSSGENLGVVHRDVSPQNILVSVNGAAKLIDFGIAKARDRVSGDATDATAGLLKGKIQYMAPEQAMSKSVDRRADVWALGAVSYYLLAGAPPYDGANQLATLHMLTSGEPPPPLPPSYPRELDALCRQALAYDIEARMGSAAELQRALERLMIASGCHTTSSDVAAFVHEHLGERVETRRKEVELALHAGSERRRAQSLPRSGAYPSPSGMPQSFAIERRSFTTMNAYPPRSSTLPAMRGVGHSAPRAPAPSASLLRVMDDDAPVSQVTSGTLGSAVIGFPRVMAPSSSGEVSYPIRRRGQHVWAAAIGVLGALVFVAVFALASFILRQSAPSADAGKVLASTESAPRAALASPAPLASPPTVRAESEAALPDAGPDAAGLNRRF